MLFAERLNREFVEQVDTRGEHAFFTIKRNDDPFFQCRIDAGFKLAGIRQSVAELRCGQQ